MGAVEQRDRIERILAGRYAVVRLLGEGALAEVFEADDLLLGQPVAVKRLRPPWARDPRLVERCKREVLAARRIAHVNVCRVFDLVVADEGHGEPEVLVTMELVPGETLADRLARRGRLPAAEVLPIAEQLCAALEAAHEAGVVHRDLKPANVLLAPEPVGEERVVVTDFGLARCLSGSGAALTATGDLLGTPAYVAPEQVRGEPVTTATDLFSLGVVLFELLTGTLPFEGDTAFETAMIRLHRSPRAPGSMVPGLDPRWDRVVLRCLALRPEDRFARARDVAEALPSRRPSAATRARPSSRTAVRAAGWALCLLAGGMAVGHGSPDLFPVARGAGGATAIQGPVEAAEPTPEAGASEPSRDPFRAAAERLHAGDLDGAAALYEETLAEARDAGDERRIARALVGVGLVHSRRGHLDQTERLYREALWHWRRFGDPKGVAITQNNLGAILVRRGRLREAEALYREAAERYADLGETVGLGAALNNRAELLLRQGHLDEAEAIYEEALAARRAADDGRGEALTHLGLARLHLERSLVGAAERHADLALDLFGRTGHPDGLTEARIVRAQAALARGAPSEAATLLEEALREDQGPPGRRRAAALCLLSTAVLAEGHLDRSEGLAHQALAEAEESFDQEGRTHALLALGEVLAAAGEPGEALRVLDRARATDWGRQDRRLQLRLAVATARAEAGAGRSGEAQGRLRAALQEARWSGLERLEGEIRQALRNPRVETVLAAVSP